MVSHMAQHPSDRISHPIRRIMPTKSGKPRLANPLTTPVAEGGLRRWVMRYGGTLASPALATLLLWTVKETIGLLNIGMIFLIVVVGATVLAGRQAGIFASVTGFALFNFFLVPPYLTFEI